MGKADYQLDGYDIFWYSNDHTPAHFNIEQKGHWCIKFYLLLPSEDELNYAITWKNKSRGPSSKELKLFRDYVKTHKEHLQQEWETKVCKQR